jgi:hypothetical protein
LNLKKRVKIKSVKFFEMGRLMLKPAPKGRSIFLKQSKPELEEVVLEKKEHTALVVHCISMRLPDEVRWRACLAYYRFMCVCACVFGFIKHFQ